MHTLFLQIGTKGGGKKGFWIDAGAHGREWIAPATAVFLIEKVGMWYDFKHLLWYLVPEVLCMYLML